MKVAVVHHTLSSLGGGEKVFTFLIKVLNENGVVPDVYSSDPVTPEVLHDFYGVTVDYNICKVKVRIPKMKRFGIYKRVLMAYASRKLIDYDVIVNTTGVYTPVRRTNKIRYILYVYNPSVSIYGDIDVISGEVTPEKYTESLFWRLYFKPYRFLMRKSVKNIDENTTLLAVSKFTQQRLEKYWKKESVVLYPPVDIDKFGDAFDGPHNDGIIIIGRFTPEKRHEDVLKLAEDLPHITFRIVGGANTPYYWRNYEKIKSMVKDKNLSNVEIYPNATLDNLIELLGRSRLFIHLMENEDFGLTPCEAVSGGVLPLVHNSGGGPETTPWHDQRFDDLEECKQKILKWYDSPNLTTRVLEHRKYVKQFSEEEFVRRFSEVIFR